MTDDPGRRSGFVRSDRTGRPLPAAGGVLLAAGDETRGGLTVIRSVVPPGDSTPLHVHRTMYESYFILDGTVTVACGDETFDAQSGDFVHLPRGLPHRYVAGAQGATFLLLGVPGGLEGFFDDWENGADMEQLSREYDIEFLE